MGKHQFFEGIWNIKQIRDGEVLWEITKRNALVNEGEKIILDAFFRGSNVPASFYVGFCYGEINEESQLVHIPNEPNSANGYARALLSRNEVDFPVLELNEGDYQLTTKEMTITASGGSIGPLNKAFMATSATDVGFLLSFISLPTTVTIQDGDNITFSIKIKAM